MSEFSGTIIKLSRATFRKREAQEQGGLLSGQDPSIFNPHDPLRLWIIQVGIIVLTTQLLALGLRKMRQPKVIAEVIGGILLGPTAFGRIPGFTEHVFPEESRPYLSLVANIGLCLFLFLVGLEIDSGVIKRNARLSLTVAFAGMTIPFGFGAALAVPLYNRFIDESVKFTHFMLFTGVAYSITAFPVLCRILTELKLLDTTVGIVVLSAGVGNDIIGWTLLALSVALVNAGSGLMALWILLTCVGWTLFLLFPVRYAMYWLARRTGSISNGPTMFFMTVTILILFGSAFMTDVIGVHAIFGAFLAGIIVPREGGLAIALTEKLEDMVSIIFLPLYFTLSGLSTDLGLLNSGIIWGFTIAICVLAYVGKFGGCTIAARFSGFSWREASTIGSLMSCKGLVELIVLNVGLSAHILDQRVFSMFVLEALLLTFITTPAVVLLYPPGMRVRVTATGANFNNVPGGKQGDNAAESGHPRDSQRNLDNGAWRMRFTVVLDRIEHLPGLMAFTQLLRPPLQTLNVPPELDSPYSSKLPNSNDVSIDALRLIELSDRTSAVMKSSAAETILHTDPVLGVFRTFGDLNGMDVSTSLSIVTYDDLSSSVIDHAAKNGSQLVVVPWLPAQPEAAADFPNNSDPSRHISTNPFEALFRGNNTINHTNSPSALHSHFVRSIFARSTTDVALYVDQHLPGEVPKVSSGLSGTAGRHHLFLPFFGGPDDRLALEFVVRLCAHPRISATVIRMHKREPDLQLTSSVQKPQGAYLGEGKPEIHVQETLMTVASGNVTTFPDTVYNQANTETRMQSETADNITWARYNSPPMDDADAIDAGVAAALTRVHFNEISTVQPLRSLIEQVSFLEDDTTKRRSRLLVVTGRSRRLAVESHHAELKQFMEEFGTIPSEVRKTVGDVTAALMASRCKSSIVVLQAAPSSI